MELLRIDHWTAGQQGQEELERKANSDLWRIQCESYHDLSWDVHKRSCFKEGERGYPKNVLVLKVLNRLFVTEEILVTVSRQAPAFKEAWPSPYHN